MTTIISSSLAMRLYGGFDAAVGRSVRAPIPAEIVGVADDVAHRSLRDTQPWTVYMPRGELPAVGSSIVLRTRGDPAPLEPAIRAAVLELGSRFEVRELRSFRDIREASILRERMLAHVSIVFAALGALLAAVGIAGVVTYSVTQRTSEIALRMALGARADDVVRQVVGRAMGLVAGGVGIGLLGVVAATPLISNWLFGVPSHDPISLGAVVLVVAASGFLGAYAPAKRATRRIDPIVLLKGG